MNVALFAPYDLARRGGVGTHIRAQARALRRLGHSVHIFGPSSAPLPYGETTVSGSIALTIGGTESALGLDPRAAGRVARLFATQRFDVVHVHEPLTPLAPWAAVWLARAPVVATFHVHRENGHALYRAARPLLAPFMRRIAWRIAVSEAARRTVAEFFPGQYEVIPNGIELARFQAPRIRPEGLPDARSIVLCVGRLEPRKGVATLIEAMASTERLRMAAALVIVGDGPERAALEQLAGDRGVTARFVGSVDDDLLPSYYQAADVVCAPALGGESFGIVLVEALAAGRPVLASRIDGYVETAGESTCVRLVPPGDARAFADALEPLLAASGETSIQDDARRLAAQYDWTLVAARLMGVYERAQGAVLALAAAHR